MLRPDELPRVLDVRTAYALGYTKATILTLLSRGHWRRLARGVFLTRPDRPTRGDWAMAGLLLAGKGSAVSGWDALRLVGLGDRRPPSAPVLVLAAHGHNRRVGQVLIRPTRRPFTTVRTPVWEDRLPDCDIADIPRAIADAALTYTRLDPVRALVTSAIQKQACSPQALMDELEASPRNRSRWLRQALEDVLDNAHSIAEAKAVSWLKRAHVPPFEVNVRVVRSSGEPLFELDIVWRELRAVLEVDGREFHFSEKQWKDTGARHNALTIMRFAVTHYVPSQIGGVTWTAEVEAWLRGRAEELGLPYQVDARVIRPGPDGHPPIVVP